MQLLYFFEKIRNPIFDFFFSLITHIGEETVFLVIAIVFFWCINKREGYYILITGLVGTLINQFLKILCRIPRPWTRDPNFTVVKSAVEEATGYSFPSGHTQNTTGTFGAIGLFNRKHRWVWITSAVIIFLVGISRMYLGVHTPWDVLASLGIAAFLLLVLYPFFSSEERFKKSMPYIVVLSFLLSLLFVFYVIYFVDLSSVDYTNYLSAKKNAYTLFGCTLGLVAVYSFDALFLSFDTKAPWYPQIIKLAVGFGIVLAIKVGLNSPLNSLFGNKYLGRAIRYFLIVIFAGIIWPLTFKFFAKMKIKVLDDFGLRVACLFNKELKNKLLEDKKKARKLNTPHGKRKKKKR